MKPRWPSQTMTDEIALTKAAEQATHAAALLNDEMLQGAFKSLEDAYTQAWRGTLIEDVNAREKLFLAINVLGKVRDNLVSIVNDGKLASRELKDLAETAERQKSWHQIR